ncbi:hypothetical protein GQ53DRAFT_56374 [Thozetella sp. PMI_491]|nr:hypothetical protein GQ53DRAFT_56374 [Thozetella sp. PMI_491]
MNPEGPLPYERNTMPEHPSFRATEARVTRPPPPEPLFFPSQEPIQPPVPPTEAYGWPHPHQNYRNPLQRLTLASTMSSQYSLGPGGVPATQQPNLSMNSTLRHNGPRSPRYQNDGELDSYQGQPDSRRGGQGGQ